MPARKRSYVSHAHSFTPKEARSLVVSHWEVNSEATVQLMTAMFQASAA